MKAVLCNHTASLIHDGNDEIDDMEETNDALYRIGSAIIYLKKQYNKKEFVINLFFNCTIKTRWGLFGYKIIAFYNDLVLSSWDAIKSGIELLDLFESNLWIDVNQS